MTINHGFGFRQAIASALGGKGLVLAAVLAGAGFQGCTTEDKAAGPAGSDAPPAVAPVAEDESGADLGADGTPLGEAVVAGIDTARKALAKAAPSCVGMNRPREDRYWRIVNVVNGCKTTQRVRFIWRWAPDGACVSIPYGGGHEERRLRPAYVTEIRGC